MSNFAISCRKLSKSYQLGRQRYDTLRDTLAGIIVADGRTSTRNADRICALDGVDLDVSWGMTLGIVGANGAGKSTLLKILSRIIAPTSGSAELCGTVGSLLEVGTGFHPELSGRENIYLNAAILGMDRDYVRRRFDEIVSFSGCERFLEMPVKRYSSGMYMRLAFAVAAHLETDILIVDEALAVGDAAFQKKCMGKIGGVAHDGRTVLFVSHSMPAVESLCQRAIRLDKGRLVDDGVPTAVITRYLSQGTPNETLCEDMHSAPGNKALRFRSARACAAVPDPDEPITVRTPVNLEFSYWVLQPSPSLTLVIQVFNRNGTLVFDSGVKLPEDSTAGLYRSGCRIAGDILNDGIHRVNLIFYCEEEVVMELDNAVVFDVLDSRDLSEDYFGEWPGAVRLNVGWRTERVIA